MSVLSRSGDEGRAARRLLPVADEHTSFDRIAALAARLLGAPAAQVSILTDVQTVAGGVGLPDGSVGSTGPLADSLCTVTATQAAPLAVTDAAADPRVNALPPVATGAVGSYLGVPLTADSGQVVGALCVHGAGPREWSESDVAVLEHLAEFVRAELELAALSRDVDRDHARWELAVEAGDIGSFDWDLATGELDWDDRLIAMYGYDSGDVAFDRSIASVQARVHPEDATLIADAMGGAIEAVGRLHVLYRIVLPDGSGATEGRVRWLEARGRALAGPDGVANRLIGVSWDVTDERDNEARAERVLAGMTVGYLAMDAQWQVVYVNAEGSRLLGRGAADLVGHTIWAAFPATVGTEFEQVYRRVAVTGEPETFEMFYPAPLNAWYEIRVVPEVRGIALYFLDITERRRNLDLLQLSVVVSQHLVGAGSVDEAVAALASMVVPDLADWSIVTLVDPDGTTHDVQTWHGDPSLRSIVERYAVFRPMGGGTGAVAEVLRTAAPVHVGPAAVAVAADRLPTDEARDLLATLAVGSAVVVPMLAGDSVAGILTLCRGRDREVMTDHELAVTESLCRRAGMAIENARLSAAQAARAEHDRTVAEALQRALLTRLPQPADLRLAARYLTAANGDQVGGDWYDALESPAGSPGSTTLMIGDVVGHDITAAASMGQLRTMLRMLALRGDASPATMLAELDRAARDLDVATLATAVTVRISCDGADGHTLRWSNAGHPPPIVVLADGRTELLSDGRADLLLGVHAEAERTDHERSLPPGASVVLYTDGLIESRAEDIDVGIAALRAALTRHHTSDPGTMLDRVLAELVGTRPDDDVALLVARLT